MLLDQLHPWPPGATVCVPEILCHSGFIKFTGNYQEPCIVILQFTSFTDSICLVFILAFQAYTVYIQGPHFMVFCFLLARKREEKGSIKEASGFTPWQHGLVS